MTSSKLIEVAMNEAWGRMAPFWPLENLIAVNPLQGLESMKFEDALVFGKRYFAIENLPKNWLEANRLSIKWFQNFFDQGQATLHMPLRREGLYRAFRELAPFDLELKGEPKSKEKLIKNLPESPEELIGQVIERMKLKQEDLADIFTFALSTLSGYAAHVKYRNEWRLGQAPLQYPATKIDFLALRMLFIYICDAELEELLKLRYEEVSIDDELSMIFGEEAIYRNKLLVDLRKGKHKSSKSKPLAQVVFCIDVRSEAFRRNLEREARERDSRIETLGFAGFFGIPARIFDEVSGSSYSSCPVLLAPQHKVLARHDCSLSQSKKDHVGYERLISIKKLYQSVKYNFTTPFTVVEALGPFTGIYMIFRNFVPEFSYRLKQKIISLFRPKIETTPDLSEITIEQQIEYGYSALSMMGLVKNFASLVIFAGHGSSTENNPFATALDCGACGGYAGGMNAKILAKILNQKQVREGLKERGIEISNKTIFMAALHNTTTDEFQIYGNSQLTEFQRRDLAEVKSILLTVQSSNNHSRNEYLCSNRNFTKASKLVKVRSMDWAQVRPEWGLARNASFIVGPRSETENLNLQGRSFLHSYDYQIDRGGALLKVILTAPMVVAEWINTQYLFSTINNVAYGAGSKITSNVAGKLGVMQGNGSDLMHGLPLQSLFASDESTFHKPARLLTIVFAPRKLISKVISDAPVLQNLFQNGWVSLVAVDDNIQYALTRQLDWQRVQLA